MTLTTRRLGTTDMEITRLGFGAWAIGGGEWAFGWGDQDDSESVAAIRHAVDSGINWIDTASVYGLGHSEEVVAKALKDLPEGDRPYVFTKCGLVWDVEQPFLQAKRVGRADSIRKDVEDSLRRLQVERIDLMQVHWPAEDGSPIEEYWGELVKLRDEGKLRAIGLSNHDAAALERAEAIGHVDSLQPPFSMIRHLAVLAARAGDAEKARSLLGEFEDYEREGFIELFEREIALSTGWFLQWSRSALDLLTQDA